MIGERAIPYGAAKEGKRYFSNDIFFLFTNYGPREGFNKEGWSQVGQVQLYLHLACSLIFTNGPDIYVSKYVQMKQGIYFIHSASTLIIKVQDTQKNSMSNKQMHQPNRQVIT